MGVKVLAEGIALEWGIPSTELIPMIYKVDPLGIRDADLEELVDTLMALGYSSYELGNNFGMLLSLALGLGRDGVRHYTLMDTYEERPLFVATLSRVGEVGGNGEGLGVCLMCGFGLKVGYERVSKREILSTIRSLFQQLIIDLFGHFNSRVAVCHVKSSNAETLLMWRYLARQNFHVNGRPVRIRITDDPFTQKPYKLVTLQLNELT